MESNNRTARIAGSLYLINIVTGIFSLIYVPSMIEIRGDSATAVNNLLASEFLYRSGVAVGLLSFSIFMVLPFVLFKLLRHINQGAAVLMVAFALVFIPIDFVALGHKLDVLSLLHDTHYRSTFSIEQLHAQMMVSLHSYDNAMVISEIFWGLWLLPFGYLVFKSDFLPKMLGIFLMVACLSDLIEVVGEVLFPGTIKGLATTLVTLPGAVGEFGICLWLLIMGARKTLFSNPPA